MSDADNNRRINNMARTVRTKVFKFGELSKEAQKKAINDFRYINVHDHWYDLSIEEHQKKLSEAGFINPKIYFSGFGAQGDGACFICDRIDFNVFLGGKYKYLDISASITHSHRYYFPTCTTVNLESGYDINVELHEEIESEIRIERGQLGEDIYRRLEEEYSYLTSEEAIAESIIANELEFTKEGKHFTL